jgi:hypothetical protein
MNSVAVSALRAASEEVGEQRASYTPATTQELVWGKPHRQGQFVALIGA